VSIDFEIFEFRRCFFRRTYEAPANLATEMMEGLNWERSNRQSAGDGFRVEVRVEGG
jgi:hypothetical protein